MDKIPFLDSSLQAALENAIRRAGATRHYEKYIKYGNIKVDQIEHAFGINEKSILWLNIKEELIRQLPVRKSRPETPFLALTSFDQALPNDWEVLRTMMSEVPEGSGIPTVLDETEDECNGEVLKLVLETTRPKWQFSEVTIPKAKSTGYPDFTKDPRARSADLRKGFETSQKYRREKGESKRSFQKKLFLKGIVGAMQPVRRRQTRAAGGGKLAGEFIKGAALDKPALGKLYGKYLAWSARYRIPRGGPGEINLAFGVVAKGFSKVTLKQMPFFYDHHGPSHLALKTKQFQERAGKGNKDRVYFVAVDFSQMEARFGTGAQDIITEHSLSKLPDELKTLQDLMFQAPTIFGNLHHSDRSRLRTTHNFEDGATGAGHASGQGDVSNNNRDAGLSVMTQLIRNAIPALSKFAPKDFETSTAIGGFNLGDDNIILVRNKEHAIALVRYLEKEPVIDRFVLEPEEFPAFIQFFPLEKEVSNGYEYLWEKTPESVIRNLVCSEYGVKNAGSEMAAIVAEEYEAKPSEILSAGTYIRMGTAYWGNPVAQDLFELYVDVLTKVSGFHLKNLYPVSGKFMERMLKNVSVTDDYEASVNLLKILLTDKSQADKVHYLMNKEALPQDLIDKLFIRVDYSLMGAYVPALKSQLAAEALVPAEETLNSWLRPDFREGLEVTCRKYGYAFS